ncbi:electron transfer flavoprotein beta subunit lysine methyltransferase isoform X1 [Heterocephalus glaber]|uniref:Electron transfer flavoprotein beta subunit lysine methyltransferase n=2 Tax=Heterocephalus glaber TaxID=10181 RepID=A0AAX6QF78_HETGA|nr:electron transfer flavoprotein beta subunit lysine methyltransferase isoform X1 [Heterocephalus glaber]
MPSFAVWCCEARDPEIPVGIKWETDPGSFLTRCSLTLSASEGLIFGKRLMASSLGWKRWGLLQAVASCGFFLFPWSHCSRRRMGSFLDPEIRAFLEESTEVTSSGSLTPEIRLRLLTPKCKFWWERADLWPYSDPYWAVYWPGGQALSRYLLDNPDVVRGKSVLDLGNGCGATAIAAHMSGASRILANDIDPVAGMAITLNCELNQLSPFPILTKNILNLEQDQWDLVVLGDMLYDEALADSLHGWLKKCIWTFGTQVLIGDPGRSPCSGHSIWHDLHKVAEYSLTEATRQQNNGLTTSAVWDFQP